jgi:glycogenin
LNVNIPFAGFAWVTLATNDSYSLGALVVASSLRRVGTQHQLAVLITPGVTEPMRNRLQEAFDVVQLVNVLDSKDAANLAVLKRPELGITFTKLHCWNLTQFEKCVFLDADVLVSLKWRNRWNFADISFKGSSKLRRAFRTRRVLSRS